MICLYIKSCLFWHYFWYIRLPRFVLSWYLFHGMVRNGTPRVCFYFLLHGKEFRVVFSSAEWLVTEFREFASIFVPLNGISSFALFRRRVRNRTMRVCFYFCSTGQILSCFLSAEGFEMEFRDFLFRGTTRIPSEITICSVYSIFRRIIFCRKFLTLCSFCYSCIGWSISIYSPISTLLGRTRSDLPSLQHNQGSRTSQLQLLSLFFWRGFLWSWSVVSCLLRCVG
jgi:hypothetical protein